MRSIFVLTLACAALLAGCSKPPADVARAEQTSGDLHVEFSTNPAPPHSGLDTIILTVTDAASGAPVGDANITGSAAMVSPKMPGSSASGRSQGNGRYEIPLTLPVATKYEIKVHIERPQKPAVDVAFPIEAWS
ncbi:hypothetical protein CCAX7_27370 [Capsulimonas corticalis]|uniref:Uncharacterized protein n=1 Tax=Capsulimonas corticalis TaxID=2219043 RepID=A0A402CTM9_9BACT|nr:FixH family protein [Capsulimonas corticalis]BDI30686.1 hypothetical protein CCAX7_27370 [Capsulimonas corticalis]